MKSWETQNSAKRNGKLFPESEKNNIFLFPTIFFPPPIIIISLLPQSELFMSWNIFTSSLVPTDNELFRFSFHFPLETDSNKNFTTKGNSSLIKDSREGVKVESVVVAKSQFDERVKVKWKEKLLKKFSFYKKYIFSWGKKGCG